MSSTASPQFKIKPWSEIDVRTRRIIIAVEAKAGHPITAADRLRIGTHAIDICHGAAYSDPMVLDAAVNSWCHRYRAESSDLAVIAGFDQPHASHDLLYSGLFLMEADGVLPRREAITVPARGRPRAIPDRTVEFDAASWLATLDDAGFSRAFAGDPAIRAAMVQWMLDNGHRGLRRAVETAGGIDGIALDTERALEWRSQQTGHGHETAAPTP